MRLTIIVFLISAPWSLISSLALHAQTPSHSGQPSAIISSGGGEFTGDSSPASGPRDASLNAAWTAERNPPPSTPHPSGLRPRQDVVVYPDRAVAAAPVVTAAAQAATNAPHNSLASSSAAVVGPLQATALAGEPMPTPAANKHLPLSPPSERFTGEAPKSSSGTLQMLFSVGSSLLFVVGLFLGVAWCYRKTLSSSLGGGIPKQVVNVLGRTSISARQQMVLVRFGPKLLLVSVIHGEARTLSEISDPLEVDQLVGLCESGQPGSITNSFKSVLLQEGTR